MSEDRLQEMAQESCMYYITLLGWVLGYSSTYRGEAAVTR